MSGFVLRWLYLGVVGVCPDGHPFAEYAVALYRQTFTAAMRARERQAIKAAQRLIEREMAELQADKETLARAFGDLAQGERIDAQGYAEEIKRSGATLPDA